MATAAVEEKVKQIIVEQLQVDEAEVTPSASFQEDLGADSLDVVELVMQFEEAFDLEIPDEARKKSRLLRTPPNTSRKTRKAVSELARRVVVTGIGLLCGIGKTAPELGNLLCGQSGMAPITSFDTTGFPVTFAAEVKGFNPLDFMDEKGGTRKMGRFIRFALAATREALLHSGLKIGPPMLSAWAYTSGPVSAVSM